MKIRSADRGGCDFDDDVARILDLGIGNVVATHIAFAVPD
jgi:hypothetical protein